MYTTAAKLQELEFFTHLNKDFCSDLSWWNMFLAEWNGVSLLRYLSPSTRHDCCIQTDASGSWGCAASLKASGFNYCGMKDGHQWELWLRSWPPLY